MSSFHKKCTAGLMIVQCVTFVASGIENSIDFGIAWALLNVVAVASLLIGLIGVENNNDSACIVTCIATELFSCVIDIISLSLFGSNIVTNGSPIAQLSSVKVGCELAV